MAHQINTDRQDKNKQEINIVIVFHDLFTHFFKKLYPRLNQNQERE